MGKKFSNFYTGLIIALFMLLLVGPRDLMAPNTNEGVMASVNLVAFVPSQICQSESFVSLNKEKIYIDKGEEAEITVTFRNCSGQPLSNLEVYLTTTRGSQDIVKEVAYDGFIIQERDGTGISTATNAEGKAYFRITSEILGETKVRVIGDRFVSFNELTVIFANAPIVEEPKEEPPVIVTPTETPQEPKTPTVPRQPRTYTPKPKIPPEQVFINEKVTEVLQKIPEPVARSFPYLLFILLAIVGLVFMWQVRNETKAAKKLLELIKIRKVISEEKQNFINLASHYLRTPLTIIKGYLELCVPLISKEVYNKFNQATKDLDEFVATVLSKVENNTFLGTLTPPNVSKETLKKYLSPAVTLPIVAIAALGVFVNYLFNKIGTIQTSTINILIQIIALFLAAQFFILAYRHKKNAKKNLKYLEETLAYEEAVDTARNDFVREVETNLSGKVELVQKISKEIPENKENHLLADGLERLKTIVEKFNTLSTLEEGREERGKEKFNLLYLIKETVEEKQHLLNERNIRFNYHYPSVDIMVYTNRRLLKIVLETVIDNAIKYSNPESSVDVTITNDNGVKIIVKDTGIGISKEGMYHLFRPFTRTQSAAQFDYQGLGFSLYLSNIILEFLGGHIAVKSKPKKETAFTVAIPAI